MEELLDDLYSTKYGGCFIIWGGWLEKRLSYNSSNEQVLNSAKPEYEKVLKDSGYKNMNLKYRAQKEHRKKNNRNRKVI